MPHNFCRKCVTRVMLLGCAMAVNWKHSCKRPNIMRTHEQCLACIRFDVNYMARLRLPCMTCTRMMPGATVGSSCQLRAWHVIISLHVSVRWQVCAPATTRVYTKCKQCAPASRQTRNIGGLTQALPCPAGCVPTHAHPNLYHFLPGRLIDSASPSSYRLSISKP